MKHKRELMAKIQASMEYSGMTGRIDGIKTIKGVPRFIFSGDGLKGTSVWPCINTFVHAWNGFDAVVNGELFIHCARCNWPHEAAGFKDGVCAECNGPRTYYKPDPIKQRARWETKKAIKEGRLRGKPERCEDCGAEDDYLNVHHVDYSDPLNIEWLCTDCHGLRHRKSRGQYAAFKNHVEARMAWI